MGNIDNFKKNTENIDSVNNNIESSKFNIENINENIVEKPNENINEKKEIVEAENNKIEELQSKKSEADIYIQKIQDIILDDGIKEIYESIPIKKQKNFEKELNKTSIEISNILSKFKDNLTKAINKIFELIRKLMFKLGISDYGYTEKMIKNKVENIIKIKNHE